MRTKNPLIAVSKSLAFVETSEGARILKFNPYHDAGGRFASGGGGGGGAGTEASGPSKTVASSPRTDSRLEQLSISRSGRRASSPEERLIDLGHAKALRASKGMTGLDIKKNHSFARDARVSAKRNKRTRAEVLGWEGTIRGYSQAHQVLTGTSLE